MNIYVQYNAGILATTEGSTELLKMDSALWSQLLSTVQHIWKRAFWRWTNSVKIYRVGDNKLPNLSN